MARSHPGAMFDMPADRIHDLLTPLYFVGSPTILPTYPSRLRDLRLGLERSSQDDFAEG